VNPFKSFVLSFVLLLVLLAGCANNIPLEEGRALIASGRTDEGLARLEQAAREHPDDRESRTAYFRQRELMVSEATAAAEVARRGGQFDAAEAAWQRVLKVDAGNARARDGLAEIAAARRHRVALDEAAAWLQKGDVAQAEMRVRTILAENPTHEGARELLKRLQAQAVQPAPATAVKSPFAKPITLEFRDTPLKTVFDVISRTAGVNFALDKDVKGDAKITIFVRNTSIDEVLRLIMATNQLQHKLLGENSVLVYPATAAKNKEYQETVTRSFYLANTDVKQAQMLIKNIAKSKDIFIDEKLNLLIMRDTPDAVRLAERLIESLDLAEPEVMLEIEVLEISRSRMLELGLDFPDQIGYGLLQNQSTTTTIVNGVTQSVETPGGTVAAGMVDLRNTTGLTTFVTNPALLLNLKSQAGDGTLLANPRIRVKNREKAKIHIGDKLPVFTTTSTANVGVSASVAYLDVGLKLDVEPSVHLDDEVDIKVGLEVSSITKEIPGPAGSLAYQVGTRSAATVLRLKHGETQVLAGLINDEERSSANRLPGLGDLPLVGRLFSSTRDNNNKTEIVLLVTPRVLRNVARPALAAPTVPAGTESNVGAPPLTVRSGHGITLSTQGASGVARPAPPAPEAAPEPAPAAPPAAPAVPPAAPAAPPAMPPAAPFVVSPVAPAASSASSPPGPVENGAAAPAAPATLPASGE
jgi:general secretion pathway protein D